MHRYQQLRQFGALDQSGPQQCGNSGGQWDFDSNTCVPLAAPPPPVPAASSNTAVYVVLGLGLVGLAIYMSTRNP